MSIKSLSRTSWLVEIEDTLHPNSDASFPRMIQVVAEWVDNEFHFRPWRVIQTLPKSDGSDHVIIAGLPDSPVTWEWLVPLAQAEMWRWLASGSRVMYGGKKS